MLEFRNVREVFSNGSLGSSLSPSAVISVASSKYVAAADEEEEDAEEM
jgi:hypothetical protein